MKKKGQFVVSTLVLVFLAIAAYLFFNPNKTIEISAPASGIAKVENTKVTQKPLYIGFIPQGNAVFMVKKWEPLADYLAKELDMPVEMVLRSSYREIINALSKGEMDICLTGAYMYVLTRAAANIRPLVRRKKFGSSLYNSIIIVRKDSGLKTFDDLKGKTFAFTEKESTSGYLLPAAMMRQKGIVNPTEYFSKVMYAGNNESVLLSVYTGNVDGAAMSIARLRPENAYENYEKELRIIWKSDPVYLGPFSVRGGLDNNLADAIKKAFLKIGVAPETIELSRHIQVEGFEEAFDSDYDNIRKARKWVF